MEGIAVFGKRKQEEDQQPPVPQVDWMNVRRFTIGTREREILPERKKLVHGRCAVRVPKRDGQQDVYAPCAYFRTDIQTLISEEPKLYEDEQAQVPLCSLDDPVEVSGERHYEVLDACGEAIGTICRIPPTNRLIHHTWRINQPGHPEIVGRNKWSMSNPKQFALRSLESATNLIFDAAAGGDPEGSKGRTLEWKAEEKLVMTSTGSPTLDCHLKISIKAQWLDRRIAFAYAMLEDLPVDKW
ncbi:hypothetical protein ABZS86_09300 [Streptomyces sp. NPDC005355]|uniref:hypothetical protein n=1 Tax=Streptomyces sp. NPDC005355 TaxID=3157038 RepID=UPI0033AF0299